MSIENRVEFLWQAAKTLQNGERTHKLLQSYYINTCRKLVKNNLQIPKEKFALSQMCPYCGSFWSDTEYGLKLIPKQLKITSKENKLIQALEKNDSTSSKILSKKQRNRAKWLKKKMSSQLAIKCFQCKHKSLLKIGNKQCKSSEPKTGMQKVSCTIASGNVSTESNQHFKCIYDSKRTQESQIVAPAPSKTKKEKRAEKLTNISILENKTIKFTPAPLKTKKQQQTEKLTNKSKLENKTKPNKKVTNKITSKTQKQNSLVQMAALLQRQINVDLKNSTQKKLEAFLK